MSTVSATLGLTATTWTSGHSGGDEIGARPRSPVLPNNRDSGSTSDRSQQLARSRASSISINSPVALLGVLKVPDLARDQGTRPFRLAERSCIARERTAGSECAGDALRGGDFVCHRGDAPDAPPRSAISGPTCHRPWGVIPRAVSWLLTLFTKPRGGGREPFFDWDHHELDGVPSTTRHSGNAQQPCVKSPTRRSQRYGHSDRHDESGSRWSRAPGEQHSMTRLHALA